MLKTQHNPAFSRQRGGQWLFVILLCIFAVRTTLEYAETVKVARHLETTSFADFFKPGIVGCVTWIKKQPDVQYVCGRSHDTDRYLYQRMSEMLYPLEYRPFADAALLKAGDLVVLPQEFTLGRACREEFRDGDLRIFRIEP